MAPSIICHFTVLFYWNKAMSSFGARRIDGLKVYTYVLYGIVLAMECVNSIIRGFEIGYVIYLFSQVLYAILVCLIVIYIFYTAYGLVNYFKTSKLKTGTPSSSTAPFFSL